MRATLAAAALAALAVGCGGRQTLDLPPAAGGATVGSAGTSGTAGTTGAAGAFETAGTTGAAGATGAGGIAGTTGSAGAVGAAGTGVSPYMVGKVDLSSVPAVFSMTCDSGVGTLEFWAPCLIGTNINGEASDPVPGLHAVECNNATVAMTAGWSFMVTFPPGPNPQRVALVPTGSVDLPNGQSAKAYKIDASITFYVVDPDNRNFSGHLTGSVLWMESSGATFECKIDTPLWGEAGNFT